jgi:uncharacterized protein YlxW (UPF0749 family)
MFRWAPAFRGSALVWLLVGLCFGLLLQVRVRPSATPTAEGGYDTARIGAAVQILEREQLNLKDAIGRLRVRLDYYQRTAASETEMLGDLRDELAGQRMRAGLVALRGPGVLLSMDDSHLTPPSLEADLNPYIIHEYDLRDAIHLLWLAGAEAIAVNDERVVGGTSVYCAGSTIMVNDTRLSPPYVVRAIGDPEALYAMATDTAYLGDLRRRAQQHGVTLTVDWREKVVLPAYRGSFAFPHALGGGP